MKVAALYVDPKGVYVGLPDVEVWDEARDARTYVGPWPVVAHPPCARWCRLAGQVEQRHGIKRGQDDGCFQAALASVRTWGGVLEHPAHSGAWSIFKLPLPRRGRWIRDPRGGWVTEVSQGIYGHRIDKPTWLYAHVDSPPQLEWWRAEPRTLFKNLSGRQRSATPKPFRDLLLSIARSARVEDAA